MKKYVVVVIPLILVLCVGVSYSYFTSDINNKESKLKISSKDLSIVLTDNMELNSNDISPGWSDSKSFTIKNNSNGSYNYNIVLKDLVNTFVTEGFLQYKITSTNGYNTKGYINIPKSDSPKDIVIGYDIDIEKGITQEYQIEFIYRDSEDIDQSEDMGKIFKGTLAIEEGTVNPNIKYSVRLNVDNATIDNNIKETIKRGSVEFNVTPNEGYTLGTNVTCDNNATGVIENEKVTISNITANTICTLDNDINTYTIEMKVINGKSNALNKIVNYNENVEFTITPNTGYTLTGATLEGDNCSIEENIVTVSNVKKDGTCTLTLARDKYQVILTGNNVTVTGSPKEIEYEGSTTFNVTPNIGFTMSEATVNCDGGASANINGNTVTISNVLQAQTCTITPKQLKYDVTLVVVNGTGNTTKSIAHAESDTFNITANSTYTLENPTISCTGSASTSYNNGVLTVSNVTGSQTCTVTLKHTSYLVTVTSNNNSYGTVSPTSQSVIHGNSATITISPKSGYKYSSNTCGGTVSGNTMTISNITIAKTCSVTFTTDNNLYSILSNGKKYEIGIRNDFSTPIGGSNVTQEYNQTGKIYKVETSSSKIDYYFAGNPSDNWIKFAGFWWRIIRTNSSEGTRLLYAGTSHDGQEGYISGTNLPYEDGLYQWNSDIYNYENVYWSNSSFKSILGSWYTNNITGVNNSMVNSIQYCNDTSYTTQSSWETNGRSFGAYNRLLSSKPEPSHICETNGFGNVAKIGMMTADEVIFAGSLSQSNANTYYYRNSKISGCTGKYGDSCSVTGDEGWWTLSPMGFQNRYAYIHYINASISPGTLTQTFIDGGHVVRPVITLNPDVLVSGSGTTTDPFIPIAN